MGTISYKIMIRDAIKSIEDNTSLFYQQKSKEGFEMLNNTLGLLINTTSGILGSQKDRSGLYIDEQELNVVLTNAMNTIEIGDTILLSDILYFDLKPLLERIVL